MQVGAETAALCAVYNAKRIAPLFAAKAPHHLPPSLPRNKPPVESPEHTHRGYARSVPKRALWAKASV